MAKQQNGSRRRRKGKQATESCGERDQAADINESTASPSAEKSPGWEPVPIEQRPAVFISARLHGTSDLYILIDLRGEIRGALGPFTQDQIDSGRWRSVTNAVQDMAWAKEQEWERDQVVESLFPSLMNVGRRIGGEIADSTGYKLLKRQHELGWSFQVFYGNAQELIGFLDSLSRHQFPAHWLSKESQGIVFGYIVRMLHNFVASAMALKDHCGNVYMQAHYKDETHPFRIAYNEEVKSRFQENPLWRFMQDLRNYTLHRGLPSVSLHLTMESPEHTPDLAIRLDVETLGEWKGWKSQSKAYLAEVKDGLTLQEVAEEYEVLVTEFYDWFITSEREAYSEDVAFFEERRQLLHNIYDLGSLPTGELAHLYGFWTAPSTWLPEIEEKTPNVN